MLPPRLRARLLRLLPLFACGTVACSSPPPPPPAPPVDAEEIALRLEGTTQLEQPVRIFFEWSVTERDARFSGKGVARIEPTAKARLDLFLSNGTTIARAALVEDELRLPPGLPPGLLPPAELMWGTLGVFRPGRFAQLRGGESLPDGRVRLLYRLPDGVEVRYTVDAGRIVELEKLRGGQVVERVTLVPRDQDRFPTDATYRDIAAFRELKMTRERLEEVEAFPPDIWEITP